MAFEGYPGAGESGLRLDPLPHASDPEEARELVAAVLIAEDRAVHANGGESVIGRLRRPAVDHGAWWWDA